MLVSAVAAKRKEVTPSGVDHVYSRSVHKVLMGVSAMRWMTEWVSSFKYPSESSPSGKAAPLALIIALASVASACGTGSAPGGSASSTTKGHDCAFSQLSVTYAGMTSGLGHFGVVIRLKNRSNTSCKIDGYPKVTALDAAGNPVENAREAICGYLGGLQCDGRPTAVNVAPGQSASALVEGSALSSAKTCPVYAAFEVTPPGLTQATTIRLTGSKWRIMDNSVGMPGCQPIDVHPVVLGASGGSLRSVYG